MDEKQQKQEAKPKTADDRNVKTAAKEEKPAVKNSAGNGGANKAQAQPKTAAPKASAQTTGPVKEKRPASASQSAAQNGEDTYDAAKDASDNKMMAIFCYIWIFVLVPLLGGAYKTSQFLKFHVNQGLVLFIFWAAYWVIILILQIVLTIVGVWWIYYFFWLLWLLPTIYGVIGVINAVNGKCRPLPLIGRFTIIK